MTKSAGCARKRRQLRGVHAPARPVWTSSLASGAEPAPAHEMSCAGCSSGLPRQRHPGAASCR